MLHFSDLKKNRMFVMGVATLMIFMVHLFGSEMWPEWASNLNRFNQNGVDIFLFLSGLGCYYSVKNSGTLKFYVKRFVRIALTYALVLIGFSVFYTTCWGWTVSDVFHNISMSSFFIDGSTRCWFLAIIVLLYAVTPILYFVINKNINIYYVLTFFVFVTVTQFNFIQLSDKMYLIWELGLTRIPVYMIGFAFGRWLSTNEDVSVNLCNPLWIFLTVVAMSLFLVNSFYNKSSVMSVTHYLGIVISPLAVLWLSLIANKLSYILKYFVTFIGTVSLECYLLNEKIQHILYVYITDNVVFINAMSFVCSVVIGFIIVSLFVNPIKKVVSK